MAKIQVLEKHVAELIAAGEVVERPSSVIKELVENSIDAGASVITVEIKNGGITYMRVTDNGGGIPADDVKTAFLRHATSKVSNEDDLNHIGTLGFRGEALASIAAVSRIELLTAFEESTGVSYKLEGGEEVSLDEAGCPKGTTIIVRDLFFNTPARMKFLKKDISEANAVAGVIDRIALSHPEVSFKFIRDGKQTLLTPGDNQLKATIYAVYGRDFTNGLIPTDYKIGDIGVSGYVSAPLAARANRNMQHFFINGRYIKSKTAMAALEQAYKNSIMVGKFPSCVLNIEIPYSLVDINVHPAKIEVRFAQEKPVFDAVYYAAKTALAAGDVRPNLQLSGGQKPMRAAAEPPVQISLHNIKTMNLSANVADEIVSSLQNVSHAIEPVKVPERPGEFEQENTQGIAKSDIFRDATRVLYDSAAANHTVQNHSLDIIVDDFDEEPVHEATEKAKQESLVEPIQSETAVDEKIAADPVDIKIIGEAFDTYIIAEHDSELVFIDKHAAHERILFEKLKKNTVNSQLLLEPVAVTLSKEEFEALLENTLLISKAGFDIEDFGGSAVLVRAVPALLSGESITEMIAEIASGFTESKVTVELSRLDWLYHNIACRAAIKAGAKSIDPDLILLARQIIESGEIKYCPHGRPVAFILKKRELEKQFGRI